MGLTVTILGGWRQMVTKDCGVSHGGKLKGNNIIFGESGVTAGFEIKKIHRWAEGREWRLLGE